MNNDKILTFQNYQTLECIHQGPKSWVYRAQRISDQQPVILKLLRSDYPSFNELIQFRHQYIITQNLNLPGIVRPVALENYRNSLILVMKDDQYISLDQYTKNNSLSLSQCLTIGIQLAEILAGLYHHRIIHKDIKPANILIHPATFKIQLIDFSIASLLPRETQVLKNPNILEGTLAYISPEQTGRMNRGIDYRTDFYSFGVTLYELLSGKLPFETTDPMELVHCHIAKVSPVLGDRGQGTGDREIQRRTGTKKVRKQENKVQIVREEIPEVISNIVMKLMAKNAEDRYQSANGIQKDLETCLHQLENTGKIELLKIGKQDICDRFIIPEKLYGRSSQVQQLLDAFERVASSSDKAHSEMMLVAGYSGVGKTAVVNEVHKPIVRQRGYFIKGKFDQFQRNIPFSAFVQALRDLMGQLLSENDAQLQHWKEQILAAVGENGQVIIAVIPELEQIIGQQSAVTELSGTAAQNRFNLLFQKFIKVLTTQEHPLVIFLDDLQWADSASLNLVKLLMSEADSQYLLLIGAYRDNEVSPAHPLMLTLDEIEKNQGIVNTITLAPLGEYDLNQLVTDTLHCSLQQALPLTQAVHQKTQGNPFFATQFLKALYEDEFINFNPEEGLWQCDLAQVKLAAVSEDVVEFVSKRLQKLNSVTQDALKLAACIGNEFDLETLAIVRQTSELETATDLWVALKEGLILPTTEVYKFYTDATTEINSVQDSHLAASYKFLHDRVQQAAYSLIPEDQKKETHLKIGQLLLKSIPESEREERIFEIVNQLNYGVEFIAEQTERDELAQLNLIACRKARSTTAYQAGREYANIGLSLLGEEGWQRQYEISLEFHELAAELASLCGDYEAMEELIEAIVTQANSILDQVTAYRIRILGYVSQNKLTEAIDIAQEVLRELGVEFPQNPTQDDYQRAFEEIDQLMSDRDIEDLIDLPIMADRAKIAIVQITNSIIAAAYDSGSGLMPFLAALPVKLSIQHGNTAATAYAYACYGVLNFNVLQNVDAGVRFGQLSLDVLSKIDVKTFKPKVLHIVGCFILHRKIHIRNVLPISKEAYTIGLEVGDFDHVGYTTQGFCINSFWCGQLLEELEPEIQAYHYTLIEINQVASASRYRIFLQTILNLLGLSGNTSILQGEDYQEAELLNSLTAAHDVWGLFCFYLYKAMLYYLFEEIESAQNQTIKTKQYLIGGAGTVCEPVFYFYDSLIALAAMRLNLIEISDGLKRVEHNQAILQQQWAYHAPMNHQHKVDLVEAEKHRVLDQKLEAMELYDKAIAGAKENEYIQEEALANELAAKFYLSLGREKVAQTYMIDAYYCYSHWGAKAKVKDLEERYPQLLAPILEQQKISLNPFKTIANLGRTSSHTQATINSNTTGISDALDLTSVIKASQALSSEIELNQLLTQLMQVMMENAGATKGVLILSQASQLTVQAISTHNSNDNETIDCTQQSIRVEESSAIPLRIINLVKRRLEPLKIDGVLSQTQFASDDYFIQQQPQSLLCLPLCSRGELLGIIYLENELTVGAFTEERVEVLKLLCSQAAISLENAQLYQKSQEYAQQLEQSLKELQAAQVQLVQSEKMSALGQMMSGIAHEINNPVGFIGGNLSPAEDYVQDLIEHLNLYQEKFPEPDEDIEDHAEEIELDYVLEDLPKLISSMKTGVNRIKEISTSMRIFARSDREQKVTFDVHEGIDSTLLILKHRLKASEKRPEIKILKDYGNFSEVLGFPGQLNQVFMNIIANAVDVFDESRQKDIDLNVNPPQIRIQTTKNISNQTIEIRIKDNGGGMSEAVKNKIFDHLFTTKAVGKGTGLGLAISRQIVEVQHGGKLSCHSQIGEGTEFLIEIPDLTQ